ncbi:reverse transcriptase domain-containing protein, partial [Tanacetum coccineum]
KLRNRSRIGINKWYQSFKDIPPQPALTNADHPVIEPWASDLDDAQPVKAKENAFVESDNNDPSKSRGTVGVTPLINTPKKKPTVNNDFYHKPFIFKESEKDVRDLVVSLFTKRIRDYDMPDDIKVSTNLRVYDGTTDPDDHLTVFMGTMDVHKLPEPAWCRFFHIKLCGAARFWYDNLASGSIDGFHQLRDKFRANFLFSRETLHMADRSDVMVSGAFISGLRPGRLSAARHTKSYKGPNDTFTALIKSPAEILATFEGKAMLRPPPRMFAPANKRDRTKYCEFYEDHGHDTNDCIDLRKEIEACVRKGRMAHLEKGAKSMTITKPTDRQDPKTPKSSEVERRTQNLCGWRKLCQNNVRTLLRTTHVRRERGNATINDTTRWICWTNFMDFGIDNLADHHIRLSWAHRPDNSSRLYDHKSPFALQYHLRTSGMMKLDAVASTLHSLMKFITKEGIAIVRGERLQTNICNQISQKRDHPEETNDTEGVEHIIVNEEHSKQTLAIASNLPKTLKEKLRELLHSNKDIFAWTPADMTSIPRELAEHRLNIHPRIFPVWQKKRVIAKD